MGCKYSHLNGLIDGQDTRELEEHSLHDGVDSIAETELLGESMRVDVVEAGLLLGDLSLDTVVAKNNQR